DGQAGTGVTPEQSARSATRTMSVAYRDLADGITAPSYAARCRWAARPRGHSDKGPSRWSSTGTARDLRRAPRDRRGDHRLRDPLRVPVGMPALPMPSESAPYGRGTGHRELVPPVCELVLGEVQQSLRGVL